MTTSRREFLRLAAGGVMAAALGGACGSDNKASDTTGGEAAPGADGKRRTLRIAQWNHLHPGYDVWFDNEYVKGWGDEHDVDVVVDHLPYGQLLTRADIELGSREGHDLFGFPIGLPFRYEDSVIDHVDIIEEARRRVGPLTPVAERTVRNAKTGRFFGFPDWSAAGPAIYRADLWAPTGVTPGTWDDVLRAGPALKAAGHPIGIGLAPEGDAQLTVTSLLFCYGGSIQDEEGNVTIGRPASVEAVKAGAELYRRGMTPEVFDWKDPVSDNRALLSGHASLIIDPISSVRAAETQNRDLAPKLSIAPPPAGPAGRFGGSPHHCYFMWQFARERELAEQFLVDLVADYREPFLRSGFYNLPAFPGGLPDIGGLLAADPSADPKGKYSVLADATKWSVNPGYPGKDNAAVEEVVNEYVVPKMFAAAARGEMSPEAAVRDAETQVKAIYDKWRERGKV